MGLATHFSHAFDRVRYAWEQLDIEPDDWQEEFLLDDGKRVVLCCSRQSGKTTMAAIRACHEARFVPGSTTLILSPSLRQSSEMFRDVLAFVAMDDSMPDRIEENKLSLTLTNGSRINSLPAKEGTVRGYKKISLIIIDESSQVPDSLYYAVRPMLAVSDGALMLLSTPYGKRGHFWSAYNEKKGRWHKYIVTADDCPRIKAEFLQEESEALPEAWFKQEYYCQFNEIEGQVFSAAEIEAFFPDERDEEFFEMLEEPGEPEHVGEQFEDMAEQEDTYGTFFSARALQEVTV